MEFLLQGRNAIVTGGASGIGLSCVKELLKAGVSKCAILDFNTVLGEKSKDEIAAEFGQDRVIFVPCDVSSQEYFGNAVKTVRENFQFEIFVNNAGLLDERKNWEKLVRTNVNGCIIGCTLAMEYMGKNRGGLGGCVVNMSSLLGVTPAAWCPIYSSTKHAVIAYTRSLGGPIYWKKTGVRVLSLCPGPTTTTSPVGDNIEDGDEDLNKDMQQMVQEHGNFQESEAVAKALVTIIKSGENGSLWAATGGKPAYELEIPDLEGLRKKKV